MAVLLILLCCIAATSAQFKDDLQSYAIECLGEGVYECLDGGCILQEKYCDGKYDCKDASDENFCNNHSADPIYCNETHQFLCADGKFCVPNNWVCNMEDDCEDKSDEVNCTVAVIAPNATCKGFLCDGTKCISKFWMCDGEYDCQDKTDEDIETTCRHALHSREVNNGWNCKTTGSFYGVTEYSCDDKSLCVPSENMCDGIRDCKDGSDEGALCNQWHTMCANFTCNDSHCVPDKTGPYCDCRSSFHKYNSTTQMCENIDSCLENIPVCSHQCEKHGEVFRCECEPGYKTDLAKYLCFAPGAEAILFFTTRNEIKYINIKSKHQSVVASDVKQAHGVTYDGTYVYWVETAEGHEAIARAQLDNVQETKEVIVALGLEEPGDIAVDWLGGNIYFTDVERGVISVCKTDGSVCSNIHASTKRPRFVTLDPRKGKMFWADWHGRSVIMSGRMDGTQTEILVPSLEGYATGLALDAPNDRLYFVDGTIKVVKLFDNVVYPLFEEPFHHPYSIAVFENTVYWSDWTSKTIQTSDKMHLQTEKRGVFVTLKEAVFNMHMYHPLLMPESSNPCMNNGCSHICVPTSNSTFSCLCPDGMEIHGRVCKRISHYHPQYLIVGGGSVFTRVQYNALGSPETHATHFDIARVQAMAYDQFRETLYIYDGHRKTINSINMSDFTLGVTRLVTLRALENVVDMGYDYVSDALYILDAGRKMIDVISLRTNHRTLVYRFKAQEIPISFCVVSEYGRLAVAVLDTEVNEIYVESIGMDGSDRVHLLTNNILGPNIRLRYSHEMDIIYIADDGHGIIDYFHPEGSGKVNFRVLQTSLASLAVTDTHVFWTDKHTQRVYWADVHRYGQKIRRMDFSIFPNTTFLHLQITSQPPDFRNPLTKHACFQFPSPCSHICVQIPHPIPQDLDMGYKCLCPIGMVLENDKCMELAKCDSQEGYCHRSNECFPASKVCDGETDCKYGEDEENCASQTESSRVCSTGQKLCEQRCIDNNEVCRVNTPQGTCSGAQFACPNSSVCIDARLVCDGAAHCPRAADETGAACDARLCPHTQFMCASGSCIPLSWKCDGSVDCADGSDEIKCENKTCPEGNFPCGDACVLLSKRCDGHFDCPDAMDENNCDLPEVVETDIVRGCSIWEFSCEHNSSICLPLTARCNGKVECPGSSDEANCDSECAPLGLFACKQEIKCIHTDHVCNGRRDCTDGSDETAEACEKANKTFQLNVNVFPSTQPCHNGYRCGDGECVEWRHVCDNLTHCRDGSDENGLCSLPCKDICPQFCRATPRGPACVCPRGYVTRGGGCADTDECEADVCAHVCTNTPGSFICTCHPGYALRSDDRGCKAVNASQMLYSSGGGLWSVVNHQHYLDYTYPKHIDDLDFNFRNKKLYLAIASTKEILEVNRYHKSYTVTSIGNIGTPTKVSLDWITGNVYFVDATPQTSYIRVCNFDNKVCARLQKLPSNAEVTSLVIDPANRRLFYCITRNNVSFIKYSSLSGRNVYELGNVTNCNGLAVDSYGMMLYVLDGRTLWKMDYDGKNRTSLFQNNLHFQNPHSPTIFEDHIYYLDNEKLNRCLLYGAKTCETYMNLKASNYIFYQEITQRVDVENMCEHSTCTNVCVSAGVCVCADGAIVNSGNCPVLKQKELILVNGEVYQDTVRHSVSITLTAVVLVIFAIYLCVFLHYHVVKKCKNRPGNYMQVRYHNRTEGVTELTNAFVEVPTAGGIGHQFVNPLMYVRNLWPESFTKTKPIGTAGITFDTQQNLSDTESDIDEQETKQILRNR